MLKAAAVSTAGEAPRSPAAIRAQVPAASAAAPRAAPVKSKRPSPAAPRLSGTCRAVTASTIAATGTFSQNTARQELA